LFVIGDACGIFSLIGSNFGRMRPRSIHWICNLFLFFKENLKCKIFLFLFVYSRTSKYFRTYVVVLCCVVNITFRCKYGDISHQSSKFKFKFIFFSSRHEHGKPLYSQHCRRGLVYQIILFPLRYHSSLLCQLMVSFFFFL